MTIYAIRHVTTYRYRNPVAFGEHRLRIRPRDGFDQRTLSFALRVEPQPSRIDWAEDPFGNLVGTISFGRRASRLRVSMDALVETDVRAPPEGAEAARAITLPLSYGAATPDLARFLERPYRDDDRAVDRWARAALDTDPDRGALPFLARLNATIHDGFAYLRRLEEGVQSPLQTLRAGQGSCRDFAVLMMDAVRAVGLAARFVSGYLHVTPADASGGVARGSMHAWLQVFLPGIGWIDYDPTGGTIGQAGLVRTAAVRDPAGAVPLAGSFIGFPSDDLGMEVEVTVEERPQIEWAPERRAAS